ncbi:MAG: hypothetical protein ACKOCD_08590 [Nitrospiraceae bacterium]
MKLTGHLVGLLRAYMQDLVEQARQEASAHESFGFAPTPYRPDQALSDLLAILDDRIESEGVQVGLPEGFLHQMWTLCNNAQDYVREQVWLESSIGRDTASKATVREIAYRALLAHLEYHTDDRTDP